METFAAVVSSLLGLAVAAFALFLQLIIYILSFFLVLFRAIGSAFGL